MRLAAGRGPTARPSRWGDDRLGIVQVDPLIFVNIPDEALAAVVERPQQRRIAAIQTIKAHPGKADPLLASMGDHLQSQVVLALEPAVRGRYPRRLTAFRVLGPRFREEESFIDQRGFRPAAQRRKHPDLTILHLAQLAAPLPPHPHRMPPFLREPALVDDQTAVGLPPQQPVGVLRHLVQHRPFRPRRLAHHVLERLMIGLRDDFLHPFHILSLRLEQPAEVMPRGGFYRSGLPAEMATKPITKANKPLANSRQQAPVVVSSNFFLMTC